MPYVAKEWLREHVAVEETATIEQIAADLVKVGLEEERIVPAAVTGPLVVGRVLSMNPEAQKNGKVINYCRVDVGEHNDEAGSGKEPSDLPSRGIVCGAHNFQVGDLVVVSLPGCVLPGPFPIASRKTYGHISDGMICSEAELGLPITNSEGIIVLQEKFPQLSETELPQPGSDAIALLGLGEELLEINITPDRGYCFSMRGVAREYAHSTGASFTDPGLAENLPGGSVPEPTDTGFPVEVADENPIRGRVGADRFVTRIVTGVNPQAPTPEWMVKRLEQAGMRSISLAVDVTNYVMLDLGQPMHAYDLGKVAAPIVVRRARKGETLETLDQVKRELDSEDLVISDSPAEDKGARVLAIAGVMGGASSEVSAETTDILLEAAHFESVSVARSARRHKLPSEAAKRFERGVDPQLAPVAAQRALDLLVEYGGGSDAGAVFDYNTVVPVEPIMLPVHEPARLVGLDYDVDTIASVLRQIGCEVSLEGDKFQVIPPSWRPDLQGAAHLVEEVARLCGYDTIPTRIPRAIAGRGLTVAQKARRDVARHLAEAGFTQVLSYPFVAEDIFDRQLLGDEDIRRYATRLANPLAGDAPLLRTSILDSLLSIATRNVARGNTDSAIYELGLVTRGKGTQLAGRFSAAARPQEEELAALEKAVPLQPRHVAGVLWGQAESTGVYASSRAYDWADAVQAVRDIAGILGVKIEVRGTDVKQPVEPWSLTGSFGDNAAVAPFHPGRCARIVVRGVCVGLAGQLHPQVCTNFNLPKAACAFEIDLDRFIAAMPKADFQVKAVSTFPPAKEDLALVVAEEVKASDLQSLIIRQAGELLEEVNLFDIYTGDQVPQGHKSLAFSIKLRSAQGTLSADEVAEVRNRIIRAAGKKFKAELR